MDSKIPGALKRSASVLGAGLLVFVVFALAGGVKGHDAEAASFPGQQVQVSSLSDVCFLGNTYFTLAFYGFRVPLTCTSNCSGLVPTMLPVVCASPPAQVISTSSATSTSCGSNMNLGFRVINSYGIGVLDGTKVTFATNLGIITPSNDTNGGLATASLMSPPKQAGIATVTVTVGGVVFQELISVSCGGVTPVAAVQVTAAPPPVYTAPATIPSGYYGY